MNTSSLIDTVLSYTDNVDSNDADYTSRRTRLLEYAQEVVDEVWNSAEFVFKLKGPTTITVPAWTTGSPSRYQLPTDFATFGKIGKVFNADVGEPLDEVAATQFIMNYFPGSTLTYSPLSRPREFAVMGDDAGNIANATPKPYWLYLPNLTAAVNLVYFYQVIPPTLVDATGDTGLLYKIPAQYHRTVILPGVVAKTGKSKGDGRDWESEYRRGLSMMQKAETPRRSSTQRLPKAISGMW